MEESLLSFDADRQFGRHSVCRCDGQQFRITGDTCMAVYAQSVVAARDDKDQSDVWIHEKILYSIQPLVSVSFGNDEPLLVQYLYKTRGIAFRRDVARAIRSGGSHQ